MFIYIKILVVKMVISEIATLIGTAILSIVSWVIANKSIFPMISKWWNDKKENDVKYKSSLQGIEQTGSEIYQSQLKFLTEEIDSLQEIIKTKSDELKRVYVELSKLRKRIQTLELELIKEKENNTLYLSNCCGKVDCKLRVPCANADKLIDTYIEDLHEGELVCCDNIIKSDA